MVTSEKHVIFITKERPMDCPRCQKPLPESFSTFTHIERVVRGKNETCPHCHDTLWIPFEGTPSAVIEIADYYTPTILATLARRGSLALRLPH